MSTKELLDRISMFGVFHKLPYAVYAPFPKTVIIEITNRCNLACKMCYRENLKETGDMPLDMFKDIIDQLPRDITLCVGGTGEPFIHPQIIEMFEVCTEKDFDSIVTVTNGTLIEKYIKFLKYLKITQLTFSIDGADKETYENIRTGSDFNLVISNLCDVISLTRIPVSVNVVVMPENMESAIEIPVMIDSISPKIRLNFQTALDFNDYVKDQDSVSRNIENEIKRKCENLNLQYNFTRLDERQICTQVFTDAFIDFKGRMTPCCLLPDRHFESVLGGKFRSAWNCYEMRIWRSNVIKNQYPRCCNELCFGGINELAR